MAIRNREEEVTRRIRHNDAPRAYKTSEKLAKRTKRRADIIRRKQGIEIKDETLIQRAFIEVLESRSRDKSAALGRRLDNELRADDRWYTRLAHVVTNYIATERGGVVWGGCLSALYEEIAEARYVARMFGKVTADEVKFAVDKGVSKKLLRRKEADDTSTQEWVCVNLSPAA